MGRQTGRRTGRTAATNNTQDSAKTKLTAEQQALVARHVGLVGVHLRMRVPTPWNPNRQREYDDLFQEGCVALVKAAARYRPQRDGVFAAYALPRIRAAVHRAIFEKFTVVHVPARAREQARERIAEPKLRPPHHVHELPTEARHVMTSRADALSQLSPGSGGETIRHVLRQRFEAAVGRALEQMRARRWRYRDPTAIMERVANERLLIGDEAHRTPLRQIAREAGVSSGRACDYERQFVERVTQLLANDPQARALHEMARDDPDGLDAAMDADRRRRLEAAQVDAFVERFNASDAAARATMLYSLVKRSTDCLPEVARNLYRLVMSDEPFSNLDAA